MPAKKPTHKQYLLDARKVRRVKRYFKAATELDAIEQALDLIIGNDIIDKAHERFFKSKPDIADVYGRLPK